MKGALTPSVFLERRSYRRRRLIDAVRLLPVLGVMLMMLPLFWPSGPDASGEPVAMSTAVIYVFAVWVLLIAAAYVLWRLIWAPPRAEAAGADRASTGDGA